MSQTDLREKAFLKDLYLSELWISRFIDFFDKSLKTDEAPENIAYLNAGTGNHPFALRDRFGRESKITAFCEDAETLKIAAGKAEAMHSDVSFTDERPDAEGFEMVVVDATLANPDDFKNSVSDAIAACRPGGTVAVMCVSAGSFGEIFSLLWEDFFSKGDSEGGALVEKLIGRIPTSSALEDFAKDAGLQKVSTKVSNEIFEMGEEEDLSSSVLLKKFLFPLWLGSVEEDEITKSLESIARLFKEDDADLSFRFSVKATLLIGTRK